MLQCLAYSIDPRGLRGKGLSETPECQTLRGWYPDPLPMWQGLLPPMSPRRSRNRSLPMRWGFLLSMPPRRRNGSLPMRWRLSSISVSLSLPHATVLSSGLIRCRTRAFQWRRSPSLLQRRSSFLLASRCRSSTCSLNLSISLSLLD